MNQIFKIIWHRASQSWVAVSELTHSHGKASSVNKRKACGALVGTLFAVGMAVPGWTLVFVLAGLA